MKACKDCENALDLNGNFPKCLKSSKEEADYVTGKMVTVYEHCRLERAFGKCGPEGQFFEPREAECQAV